MRAERLGTLRRRRRVELRVVAVGVHLPRLTLIPQRNVEDLPEPLARGPRRHRDDDFHAVRQVAKHPVGRSDEELAVERIGVPGAEMEDPGMLEEPADDRPNANRLAGPGHARPQAAGSADDEVDRHAGP